MKASKAVYGILLVALFASEVSRADGLCARLLMSFQGLVGVSIPKADEIQSYPEEIALPAATRLNRLLFPLMRKLQESVASLSEEEIRVRLDKLSKKSPVRSGKFEKNIAMVDDQLLKLSFEMNSVPIFQHQITGYSNIISLEDFLYVNPDKSRISKMGEFHSSLSATLTPVGAYGRQFSYDMLRTTQLLSAMVEEFLTADSARIYQENRSFFEHNMHRAERARVENATPELSINSAMIEGILSFNQMISAMLGTKIQGIESGEFALDNIVHNGRKKIGLTSEFTLQIPPGMVAPMSYAGLAMVDTFAVDSEGKLIMADNAQTTIARIRQKLNPTGRNSKCPMAAIWRRLQTDSTQTSSVELNNQPGLQILAETFFKLFKVVSHQSEQAVR